MLPRLRAYIQLTRPLLFFVPLLPYLIAALMARLDVGSLNYPVLVVGLLTVWIGQLITRFFNEYYDQESDAINQHRTPYSGGSGVLRAGLLHPRTASWSAFIALGLSLGGLFWLSALGAVNTGTLILFGMLVFAAVAYSVPPLMLVQRGLGELDVTLVFALLVPLFSYNLQTGDLSLVLVLTCLPFAALIFAMMLLVGIPDYEADQAVGKRTLVVRIGQERAARWYGIALLVGYLSPWLTLGWGLPIEVLLLQLLAAPLVVASLRSLDGKGILNPENFLRNLRLGAAALLVIGVTQIIGFLIA